MLLMESGLDAGTLKTVAGAGEHRRVAVNTSAGQACLSQGLKQTPSSTSELENGSAEPLGKGHVKGDVIMK